MPDIGSKVTHVIQSNEKGEWKNMTKHEGLADAKAHMQNYIPKKNSANYRIKTLAQTGLSKSTGDSGNSPKTKAIQDVKPAPKKAAPAPKKAVPVVKKAAPAPKKAAPVAKKAAPKKGK
jgi:hypothetical protein